VISRLRFFKEAAAEIEHERGWYRDRSHVAEASFLRELEHAFEAVAQNPDTWPHYLGGTRRYVFPKFPFSLVYFVESGSFYVVALAAEHRPPGYWLERLRNGSRG
jgi:plasmid stabilization system protein ParE